MNHINHDYADKTWIKHDPNIVDLFDINDQTNHYLGAIRITLAVITAILFIHFGA